MEGVSVSVSVLVDKRGRLTSVRFLRVLIIGHFEYLLEGLLAAVWFPVQILYVNINRMKLTLRIIVLLYEVYCFVFSLLILFDSSSLSFISFFSSSFPLKRLRMNV